MKCLSHRRPRGLTLTELLVVMAIATLLATLIVMAYVNRMEQARVAVAEGECRTIGMAEEACSMVHGYYLPFQVLDDRPSVYGITDQGDVMGLENWSSIRLVDPLIPAQDQYGNQFYLSDNQPRIRDMRVNWQGPFINYQRVYTGNLDPRDPNFRNNAMVRLDFPLDPWGNPYRFYSPVGIIGSGANTTDYSNLSLSFSDGYLTNNDNRFFERYAVVSWGRNNQSDLVNSNDEDDIIYLFGTGGVESNFSIIGP